MPRGVSCRLRLLALVRGQIRQRVGLLTSARDRVFMPTVTLQLHHADTTVTHPRARPDLEGPGISLGVEGAVPGILVLVAAEPVALSVIAVWALAMMNHCGLGHEVLVDVPRAHDVIVEGLMRCLEDRDDVAVSRTVGTGTVAEILAVSDGHRCRPRTVGRCRSDARGSDAQRPGVGLASAGRVPWSGRILPS